MAIAKFRNGDQVMLGSQAATEPALAVGSVTGALAAVYVIVNLIWPNLLSDQLQIAISNLVVVLGPVILSWFIRMKVWSPASVAEVLDVATSKGKHEKPEPPVIL